MFKLVTAITDCTSVFGNCNHLTTLPADLFRYNTAVTTFDSAFYQCTALTHLPAGLIGSTVNANLNTMFQSCPIATIDADCFRYFTGATDAFFHMFSQFTTLTAIPGHFKVYFLDVPMLL
jgi:hypothetical protein